MAGFLDMKGIVKTFPGVIAVNNVDFSCFSGEVHSLIGENGAGKTTLMNILGGVYRPDAGHIFISDELVQIHSPADALNKGIGFIHQEFNLLPNLTVCENVFLAREIRNTRGGLDYGEMERRVRKTCEFLGYDLNPHECLGNLSVAEQQLCEITRAVMGSPRILIMDEPTASLAENEVQRLFTIIEALKANGVGIIYISHRLDEILHLSDRVSVLKDGKLVGVLPRSKLTRDDLITMMVGRTFENIFPPSTSSREPKPSVLQVQDVGVRGEIEGVNLTVGSGEIVGLGGLEGQGQRVLARAIFGDVPISAGAITLAGKSVAAGKIKKSIREGIGYVTHDRRGEGLILHASVRQNSALASLWRRQKAGLIQEKLEIDEVTNYAEKLDTKCRSISQRVGLLSGGNQQKVMLARWLMASPQVLIFDEPTKGIDVGARVSIYQIIRELADQGMAIILLTSDMIELIGLADRIAVFYEGKITGRFSRDEVTEEKIMQAASGIERGAV